MIASYRILTKQSMTLLCDELDDEGDAKDEDN